MKIGIELPDNNVCHIDFGRPEQGNPGVGGSEYLFSLLAKELYLSEIDITVYHYNDNILPDGMKHDIVENAIEMLHKADADGIDILIHQVGKTEEWYNCLERSNLKSIAWAHVYLEHKELCWIRDNENVKRVVFVGKEEYDSYIDDDVIFKSTYIYNMISTNNHIKNRNINKPIVTYVGSLVPAKGFHLLAKIWPKIIKKVPNAELYVVGNGKVYDRNAELGHFGIAQAEYEDSFIRYLLGEDGNILPSVHFLGIVGADKASIFQSTAVGVVNPSALTETFCMSAVEMEFAYVPVISRGRWGLLDTVVDGSTGFLFKNESEFIRRIVYLLKNPLINFEMGCSAHNFVKKSFSTNIVIPQWKHLLDEIMNDVPADILRPRENLLNDFKWIKQIIRFLRFNCKLKFIPSFCDIKFYLKKLLRK